MPDADEKLLVPSETLLELRHIVREVWVVPSNELSEEVSRTVGRISDDVGEALPNADLRQVGWGIFAVASSLALKAEVLVGYARKSIPPAQMLKGVRGTAELTCWAGEALISRGERAAPGGSPDGGLTFNVGVQLVRARSRSVAAAGAMVDRLLPSAELAGALMAAIGGHERDAEADGMLAEINRALSGMDDADVGWGLLVCGSSLLALADEAAPPVKPRRRVPRNRPNDDADLLGAGLVGSVFVLAGDALIKRRPPAALSSIS